MVSHHYWLDCFSITASMMHTGSGWELSPVSSTSSHTFSLKTKNCNTQLEDVSQWAVNYDCTHFTWKLGNCTEF